MHALTALSLAACLALGGAPAERCRLATGDGLDLELDTATGAVRAVTVFGRQLPLILGSPGGLSLREWRYAQPSAPKPLAKVDFESPQGWVAMIGVERAPKNVAVERRTDGGARGSRGYARLGASQRYGHGIGLAGPLPVEPDKTYEIAWQGRAARTTDTFLIYVRPQNAAGQNVAEAIAPPAQWAYSPYSKTHFQESIAVPAAGAWSRLSRTYQVPPGVVSLQIGIYLWRGDHVDVDQVEVRATAGAQPHGVSAAAAPLVPLPDGAGYRQCGVLAGQGLQFELTYRPKADHLRIEGEVRDASTPPRDRAIEVQYTLPVRCDGWSWHDDMRRHRSMQPGVVYGNHFAVGGHRVSRYPFACITSAAAGLAVGVPMHYPAIQSVACSTSGGLSSSWDFGLAAGFRASGRGRATFTLVIHPVDPAWGFRSPEQYDRDRDLFKKYVPIIRRTNLAGWEPVTHAAAAPDEILIERFGHWSAGTLHFTVRNPGAAARQARVTVELARLGAPDPDFARLTVRDLVSQRTVAVASQPAQGTATIELEIDPYETVVLHLEAARK